AITASSVSSLPQCVGRQTVKPSDQTKQGPKRWLIRNSRLPACPLRPGNACHPAVSHPSLYDTLVPSTETSLRSFRLAITWGTTRTPGAGVAHALSEDVSVLSFAGLCLRLFRRAIACSMNVATSAATSFGFGFGAGVVAGSTVTPTSFAR